MRFAFWPRGGSQKTITRGEAFDAYLTFMEGRGAASFTHPSGDFSMDQICRDVEGIILHETRDMPEATWGARLNEFRRRRGRQWRARESRAEAIRAVGGKR